MKTRNVKRRGKGREGTSLREEKGRGCVLYKRTGISLYIVSYPLDKAIATIDISRRHAFYESETRARVVMQTLGDSNVPAPQSTATAPPSLSLSHRHIAKRGDALEDHWRIRILARILCTSLILYLF